MVTPIPGRWDPRTYLVSASETPRLDLCIGGLVLPQMPESWGEASHGQLVHNYLFRAKQIGRAAALDELTEFLSWSGEKDAEGALLYDEPTPETEELLDTLEAIPIERIPEGLDPEVAIAWNLRTGEARFLGSGIGRDYTRRGEFGPDWIVGTADLLGQTEDGQHLIVPDYKTGVMRQRAKHSRQLSTLALLASKLTGIRSAHVSNLYIGRKGTFRPDLAELGPLDLDAQEERLRELPARRARAEKALAAGHLPDLAVGEQCRYCPSVLACPTHTEAVRGFVHPASLTRLVQRLPECSAEELKHAVVMSDLAKRHLRRLDKALKLEADHEPIALDGGMEYRRVATSRTDFTEAGLAEMESLKADLKARGETVERTVFKHVVAAARAPIVPALPAFDGDAADDEEG